MIYVGQINKFQWNLPYSGISRNTIIMIYINILEGRMISFSNKFNVLYSVVLLILFFDSINKTAI